MSDNYVYTDKQVEDLQKPLTDLLSTTSSRITDIKRRIEQQNKQIDQFTKALSDADLYVDSIIQQKQSKQLNITPLVAQCTTVTGRRSSNEDEEIGVLLSQQKVTFYQIYAVFDGHAGNEASQFCKQNFIRFLSESKFLQFGLLQQAIQEAFLNLDEEFCKQTFKQEDVGTTAACVIFDLQNDEIVIANAGDARVVIKSSAGVLTSTQDHKPNTIAEQQRLLQKFNTKVIDVAGVARVCGSLAVSRSIGDKNYKIFGVCSKPDCTVVKYSVKDVQWCVVACDGLFDVFSNQMLDLAMRILLGEKDVKGKNSQEDQLVEAFYCYKDAGDEQVAKADAILARLGGLKDIEAEKAVKIDKTDLSGKASQALVRASYFLNSTDNVTCIVILQDANNDK